MSATVARRCADRTLIVAAMLTAAPALAQSSTSSTAPPMTSTQPPKVVKIAMESEIYDAMTLKAASVVPSKPMR